MKNKMTKPEQERFHQLLMGALDGELTPEDEAEFNRYITQHPECQKMWQEHKQLKEVTRTMKLKSPPSEVWDRYWINVYNRIERSIAWIVFSIGCIVLLVYGLFKAVESVLANAQLVGIVKIGILAVIAGGVILLVSVLREKLFTRKKDPYKEIQR